jgi:hypothetical protein
MRYLPNCLLALLVACSAVPAHASTVLFAADVNTPVLSAKSVIGANTGGAEMVGMQVTVNFVGGGSTAGAWATNVSGCTQAADCGTANGTIGNGSWTLTETGNTGSVTNVANPDGTALNPWTLTSTSTDHAIASVVLNGIPAQKVFDRDLHTGGQVGTPGSAYGIDYTFHSESGADAPYTVTVTYAGLVTLDGPNQQGQGAAFSSKGTAAGVGDLWSQLTFAFTSGGSFMATAAGNAVWSFFQDTDTADQLGAGDYNHNGIVDAADYVVWRDSLGRTGSSLAADGNGNGVIDTGDYDVWKAHFGQHTTAGAGAADSAGAGVPEPSAALLLIFGGFVLAFFRYERVDRHFRSRGRKCLSSNVKWLDRDQAKAAFGVLVVI